MKFNYCLSYKMAILIVSIVLLWYIAPYIIWGEDMYVTVWDNMDQLPNLFGLSKLYGLFTLDGSAGIWDNMPCIYMGRGGFTIQNFVNHYLPYWEAYSISRVTSIVIGFFSMRWMLKTIFRNDEDKAIVLIVSMMYAILPVIPEWEFACATLPLYYVAFCKLYNGHEKKWILIAFLLVFFMEFNVVMFVAISWFIATVCVTIRDRKLPTLLVYALFVICAGMVIFNFRLFYMKFSVHEDLNRDHFRINAGKPAWKIFALGIKDYFFVGQPHASSLQKYIILPTSFIFALVLYKQKGIHNLVKGKVSYESIVFLLCMISIAFIALVGSLDDAHGFDWLKRIFPPLNGFLLSRFYIISRCLWYVGLAAILIYVSKQEKYKWLAAIIVCLQVSVIMASRTEFNDSSSTIVYKLGIKKPKKDVTWREFYAENLYDKIKRDINYNGEHVAAVGFHPSILLYNGMNAIDGYWSCYPYKYMKKWHRLIDPEFSVNEEMKKYFEQHGIRRYLYCKDADCWTDTPRVKREKSVVLRIDKDVFTNDYHGKYIISCAPLKNSADLGLRLIGRYTSNESIYNLYVYRVI